MSPSPPPLPASDSGQLTHQSCPKCRYSLRGLPAVGECPECGFGYDEFTFERSSRIRLQTCPKCQYSLRGLPNAGRCPECGFTYDDETFMLYGIVRGMAKTSGGRKAAWIFVGAAGSFAPACVAPVLFAPGGAVWLGLGGLIWLIVLIYLLATSKKDQPHQPLLFARGGFGTCAGANPSDDAVRLVGWEMVDAVELNRVSPTWRRLRIGTRGRRGQLSNVKLDAGISADEDNARRVVHLIEKRIAAAHGHAPPPPLLPGAGDEDHDLLLGDAEHVR